MLTWTGLDTRLAGLLPSSAVRPAATTYSVLDLMADLVCPADWQPRDFFAANFRARNLIMDFGGQAERMKFMIRDRGSNFTTAFDAVWSMPGSGPCSVTYGHPA